MPAYFQHEQLVFAPPTKVIPTSPDIDTILREREATIEYRKKNGFNLDSQYGHFRISMP